ncbi:DMT family transporter [Moritella sp. 36]|uniref:DMT family transporter n=1 Tax=Moritella sp. 36 TaxID=2746233 RepID=UPI001BA85CEF|nr:DMT family transporter [Moritella sp. 36]QUM88031.1 DMT family transporter [Moritella sp. 36]
MFQHFEKYNLSNHALCKYKEALIFCIISSVSFILMAEAVKTVDPVTSTFITYSLTAFIFTLFNSKNIRQIITESLQQPSTLLQLNITTLANTLLAFVVMTYVSPLIYAIVFFGCLPFFNSALQWRLFANNKSSYIFNLVSCLSAIFLAFYISDRVMPATAQGISYSLISCFFAALYMQRSEYFHRKTGLTPSQVLSVRFYLVILACGSYALLQASTLMLNSTEWLMLSGAAITGSVIPLFLMQVAIKKLGAAVTAQFMPSIPVLCMTFLTALGIAQFSGLEILAIVSFSMLLIAQIRYKVHKRHVAANA